MPTTINGIGTHYYGKKNLEEYPGQCESCGRPGNMRNYETRLWFVVVFVPVIPLGRKQILDDCPYCRRHKVIKIEEWERIKSQAIEQSGDQLAEDQDNPEAAMNMHMTLTAFHKNDEAGKLASIMREKFGDDAQVQLYLAGWYEGQGKNDEMRNCLEKAYEIDPDHAAVKRAMGMTLIDDGQVEKGHQFLKDFEPPSPNYEPPVFFRLAKGYQDAQEHEKALGVFQMILNATPGAGTEKDFRKAVRESEKTLNRPNSILPSQSFISGKGVAGFLAMLLILGGLWYWNHYISTHRSVHVVNGFSVPMSAEILPEDGGAPVQVTVGANSKTVITLSEGSYQAQVKQPDAVLPLCEPYNFNIRTGFWARYFKSPVFVIDPGRSSVVMWSEVIYSARPQNNQSVPFTQHIGKPTTFYPDIDYIFEEPPNEIKLKSGGKDVKRTTVYLGTTPAAFVPAIYADALPPQEWLSFLERHLRANPENDILWFSYTGVARQHELWKPAVEFLEQGLDQKPIRLSQHQAYMDAMKSAGRGGELIPKYEQLLADTPESAELAYLRGELCEKSSEAIKFFQQATDLDENLQVAWSQQASMLLNLGQFAEAKTAIEKSWDLVKDGTHPIEVYWGVHLALKDFDVLDTLLNSKDKNDYRLHDPYTKLQLAKARGELKDVEQALKIWEEANSVNEWPAQERLAESNYRRIRVLLLLGQADEAVELFETLPDQPEYRSMRFQAYLQDNQPDLAASQKLEELAPHFQAYHLLCLALSYHHSGNSEEAQTWEDKAVELLQSPAVSQPAIAQLLTDAKAAPPKFSDAKEIIAEPHWKAVILCLLAKQAEGEDATKIRELAETLNYREVFPANLITEALKK